MKIVLFGFRFHPYTLEVLEKFQQHHIQPLALVEATPHYSLQQIADSPDVTEDFFSELDPKQVLSFWTLQTILRHPLRSLPLIKKVLTNANKIKGTKAPSPLTNIQLYRVRDHTGISCEKLLKKIQPDLLVLCPAASIIRKNILTIPTIGTINAHMGLLPHIRGMNALEWTIFTTGKAHISVHFVEEGLDEGAILSTREIKDIKNQSIAQLRRKGRTAMAEELAVVIKKIKEHTATPTKQKKEEGKQYFTMHKDLVSLCEVKLRDKHR